MAINPNDFMFHSDYTVNGLLNSYQETLNTTAVSLAPGAVMTIYGDYHDIGSARSTSIASWVVPNLPQANGGVQSGSRAPGAIQKGSFHVSTSEPTGQQPMGIWFFPYAAQSGQSVRAAIKMFNNTSTTLTVPVAAWKMKISTYIVPPNTV